MILPGGTGEQEVSIDYTYDALNRLISAEYSNGTAFGYTYDAAGNVLTYAETHYDQTTVTTYTYDAANQLLNATEEDTTWYYSYDGNGSLIQTDPGTEVAIGSTRYTYNTAGFLTKVENYSTEWQTQSEMTYDGLGNRLEVTTYTDGEGNTTRYVLDGGAELTAIGAESSTYYLYGRGVIGTLGESWNYILSDGAGSTRQLVDEEGAVTLSVSYTPWGDTMEIYGSGMLNLGYLGGVYDAGTGLIYMGNGQYYDPYTRRFLNRGSENQSDPYAPWSNNVASMLISPLTLLVMVYGRKKKRTKIDNIIVVLVLVLTLSTSMFVVSESIIPSVSADVDRPPIGWPPHPYEDDETITLPADFPGSVDTPVVTIPAKTCRQAPDTENFDPTKNPDPFMKWNPSVSIDYGLGELWGGQFFPDANSDRVPNDAENAWGQNLCGHSSVALILQTLYDAEFPLKDMYDAMNYIMTGSVNSAYHKSYEMVYLAQALAIVKYRNNYDDLKFLLHENQNIYSYYVAQKNWDHVENDIWIDGEFFEKHWSYSVWASGFGETSRDLNVYGSVDPQILTNYLDNIVKPMMNDNHYYIGWVQAHPTTVKLLPRTNSISVGHWVLITGFSNTVYHGSTSRWVRIYNPGSDGPEYYPLDYFLTSFNATYGLEVWR